MQVLFIVLLLLCVSHAKAEYVESFTVCVRFMISHFDVNNMLAVESRDAIT